MSEYPSQQSPFHVEPALASRLAAAKEAVWFRIGVLQSAMNDRERALDAFERVLLVNPSNVRAMTQAGAVLAKKECYPQAVSYLQRAISSDSTCGEAWAVLAHCYVMTDDLQKAYQAYQSALSHLPNPRDPNLWYGIGLLYDRYGSLDNALEAFLAVLNISPDFERADEVCFCIGIIYKEQQNFEEALKYFQKVVTAANPPPPLTRADGWYQIGHVNELKRDIPTAFEMYKAALAENSKHPKTLQNIGWLEHQHNNNSAEAIRLLKMSADLDPSDGQTWYLLGRVYMALREFRQAYDAYQQAVYRDGRNATFWCSIGVLYYQMNQYRDAMDAYSRAIRLNPYVSEVWYDLGTLYESCGQNADAIDAYRRAAELAPDNTQITARLAVLENSMTPAALQQQQQAAQAAASQAQGMQPGQVQPEMHHAGQPHLQSHAMLNRPMAPLGPMAQPLQQQKLPHQAALPPSHQMAAHSGSLEQSASGQASGAQRTGQMEISPISALRPHAMMQSQSMGGQSGGFSQDARPSLPAPLTSMNATGVSRPSPMMSQPLHSQPQSNVLPPPNAMTSHQESMHSFRRSGPLPHTQLNPLNHHPATQDPHRAAQMSHADQQQPPTELPALASSQPQAMHQSQPSQEQQGTLSSPPHRQPAQPQAQQSSPHMTSHEQQAPGQQAHLQQPPLHLQSQQQAPHSQPQHQASHSQPQQIDPLPSQPQTGPLPHIQALPQLQALPQMQQHPEQQKRAEMQQHPIPAIADPQRHGPENDRAPYMQQKGERLHQQEYERPDEARLPKLTKPEGPVGPVPFAPSATDGTPRSQPSYIPNVGSMHSIPSSGTQIPPLREPVAVSASGPLPPRSMSMHEITQQEPPGPRRIEEPNIDERGQNDRTRVEPGAEMAHQNGEKSQVLDRLPGMSSLSAGPVPIKDATRDSREDARLLTSVATPALSIPSSVAIPSMTGSEIPKLSSSPVPIPSVSGAIGSGAPPLPPMSTRPPSSLGGMGQESKEPPSSIGSSGLAVGASSLTKFGKGFVRTPATPVNSSVAPSSLPSPLPARKGPANAGIVHAAMSPRMSKPASTPTLKSVPIPPSSSTGQIESVPSPSSLPVLPALSSHPTNSDNDKASPKDKSAEQEPRRDDGEAMSDVRPADPKSDEQSGKENASTKKSEDGMVNKPLFGILRSAPAPVPIADSEKTDKEENVKSPGGLTAKPDAESTVGLKRESSSKDEPGRTAKRPRLHDINDSDNNHSKSFGYDGEDKQKQDGGRNDIERNKDDDMSKGGVVGPVQSEIPSFQDTKADLRASNSSQAAEPEKPPKRENVIRSGETESGKSLGVGGQVIDLPRLSTPMSKLPGPPSLPGNTPLPSFRAERMNLTASRVGSGSGSGGKSTSQENTPRFAIRSAPVTSLTAPLKSHVPSSSRGGADTGESSNSQKVESSSTKRVSEDKPGSSPIGGSNARDDASGRVANGDAQKGTNSSGEHESRGTSDVKAKDEKQSSRTEIHSSAT